MKARTTNELTPLEKKYLEMRNSPLGFSRSDKIQFMILEQLIELNKNLSHDRK
jgi:hypothetical protein